LGTNDPTTLHGTAEAIERPEAEIELLQIDIDMAALLDSFTDEELVSFERLHHDPESNDPVELSIYVSLLLFLRTSSAEHLNKAMEQTEGWIAALAPEHPDRPQRFQVLDTLTAQKVKLKELQDKEWFARLFGATVAPDTPDDLDMKIMGATMYVTFPEPKFLVPNVL